MRVPTEQMRGTKQYKLSGKLIKSHDNCNGYKTISLHKDGSQWQTTVHRLVATAFVDNPDGKPEVNHIDGNKKNNNAWNLEWVTRKENIAHAVDVLDAFSFNRRFTEDQIASIRADDRCERLIAKDYGVNQSTVNAIRVGRTYKKFPGKKNKAGRSRQRKLTDTEIKEIRTSSDTGVSLAKKFGVASSTICKIKKNQRYREVV